MIPISLIVTYWVGVHLMHTDYAVSLAFLLSCSLRALCQLLSKIPKAKNTRQNNMPKKNTIIQNRSKSVVFVFVYFCIGLLGFGRFGCSLCCCTV